MTRTLCTGALCATLIAVTADNHTTRAIFLGLAGFWFILAMAMTKEP